MLRQIVDGALLLSLCVFLHAVATIAIAQFRRRALHHGKTTFRRPVLALAGAFVFIFLLHVCEIAIWAGAYVALGALSGFEQALYFSAVSFTTVGYGDVVLSEQWRILGVSEAVVGMLLFGWSVGLLLILINDAMKQIMEWQ
jgi:voltage-gated potassium channel Kch